MFFDVHTSRRYIFRLTILFRRLSMVTCSVFSGQNAHDLQTLF